jgi:hypothetical protein
MTVQSVANRIRNLIPDDLGIALRADPEKHGESAAIIVTPDTESPEVYLITVLNVTDDESWLAEAILRARL